MNTAFAVRSAKLQFVDTPLNQLLSADDVQARHAGPLRLTMSHDDANVVNNVHNVKSTLADAATFALAPVTMGERGDVPWRRIRDDVWLLNRVVYKSSNQHRSARFFDVVQRAVRLQRHLWRSAHIDDVLRVAFAIVPNRAKQRTDNRALYTVQVHATAASLIVVVLKLLIVRDELSAALSALRATRVPLQTQLALGFFAPLALTCLSACARIHSECLVFRARIDELVTLLLRIGTLAPFGNALELASNATAQSHARITTLVYDSYRNRLRQLVATSKQSPPIRAPTQQEQHSVAVDRSSAIDVGSVVEDVGEAMSVNNSTTRTAVVDGPSLRIKPKKRKKDDLDDIFAALDRR